MKTELIRSDFDRLALLDPEGWNHKSHYHSFLLKNISPTCRNALEIGCGTGTFVRLLTQRGSHVLALDLSPEMITLAKKQSQDYPNIDFQMADFMDYDLPDERYDNIVSIATLHHLPLENVLERIKPALSVGGTLLVLDLFEPEGLPDLLIAGVAVPVNLFLKLRHTGHLRETPEVRAAWTEHGKHDSYLPVSTVRQICKDLLPGAKIRKHLLWRYSIVWNKK
jgi:SAM-dependent methyltransferase